jgi:hypothetical protein
MHRDVDGICGHVENRTDLAPAEVGTVPERDQLPVSLTELRDSFDERKATHGLLGKIV